MLDASAEVFVRPNIFASLIVLLFSGCGLLLDVDAPDPTTPPDLGVADLGGIDLGQNDAGIECTSPADCSEEDGVMCTRPECDTTRDQCKEVPDDRSCPPGQYCDAVSDCLPIPSCGGMVGCPSMDPCLVGTCAGGMCAFAVRNCAAELDALLPGDCREIACDSSVRDPATACYYAPIDAACRDADDGFTCTKEVCNPSDGTCDHVPDPTDCDDSIDCTHDDCNPGMTCPTGSGSISGCTNVPDDGLCGDVPPGALLLFPGLACATSVCLGASASNPRGCGFEDGCASGEFCRAGACLPARSCTRPTDCDDENPCNGVEICGTRGTCARAPITPCRSTPTGLERGVCSIDETRPEPVFCAPFYSSCP